MMFGSFLAVMVSQRFVFLIVATTWLIMLVLTVVMMRQMEELIEVPDEQDVQEEKAGISTWRFVFNKTILSFIVLIQNPYIVFGSFIFYYVPIFCDKKGYSETICSILIMLYSEVAVLGTDKLTEWFSRVFRKYSMYIAIAMNIVALVVFAFLQNMVGMIIALLIMGISAAYGKPIQQNYFLELKQVKSYGEDKSIGIYNFSENIGESLGPVVFGRLMEAARLAYSAGVFCAVIAGMGALHYIIDRKELKYGKGKVHTSA
jgi:predicted MFS family arabinose efflux permease